MRYKVVEQAFDEAKKEIAGYKNALIYQVDAIQLFDSGVPSVDWDKCVEARFFSEEKELRFFQTEDGEWKAALVADAPDDDVIDSWYRLSKRFGGGKVCVREYLDYDEDGQAVVVLTRLVALG